MIEFLKDPNWPEEQTMFVLEVMSIGCDQQNVNSVDVMASS